MTDALDRAVEEAWNTYVAADTAYRLDPTITTDTARDEAAKALEAAIAARACRPLVEALDDLQKREAAYREAYVLHGDGTHESGYCWDQMRHAGDRARAALAAYRGTT